MTMLTWQVLNGDALSVLETLPEQSVNCVVTSPPYFGLRDYGTSKWDGGHESCTHVQPATGSTQNKANNGKFWSPFRNTCGLCGAIRIDAQLGLEPSPSAYVENLVQVFRQVKRVLRDDGVCWLNLGDSYAGSWGNQGRKETRGEQRPINGEMLTEVLDGRYPDKRSNTGAIPIGLKPKDLMGIPWRVAFALQADGWYLRSDVIWHKKSCMPESVTDRPTRSHEYVFLLTKNARYWYDADAIREPHKPESLARYEYGLNTKAPADGYVNSGAKNPRAIGRSERMADNINFAGANARTVWNEDVEIVEKREVYTGQATKDYDSAGVQDPSDTKRRVLDAMQADDYLGANARTVWSLGPEPFDGEHFAVMPRQLARRCILAGCPFGGTVLDPFAGSGTSGVVALEEGRNFIGVELSEKYHAMARTRIGNVAPLLASEVSA